MWAATIYKLMHSNETILSDLPMYAYWPGRVFVYVGGIEVLAWARESACVRECACVCVRECACVCVRGRVCALEWAFTSGRAQMCIHECEWTSVRSKCSYMSGRAWVRMYTSDCVILCVRKDATDCAYIPSRVWGCVRICINLYLHASVHMRVLVHMRGFAPMNMC